MYCKLDWGGWIPKGRKWERGEIPAKYDRFQEMTSADYLKRTEANIVDSDATVVFTAKNPTGGSLRTIEFCMKHGRPWHHVALDTTTRKKAVADIVAWLRGDPELNDYDDYKARPPADCVLNVAGSRESKQPGIADAVMAIVVDVVGDINGKCFYPLSEG